ncbi:hypothetical protein M6B38_109700 [Iris pallida]|uniref:Uncharacterized protein n=1 Tax=Iris pallida TaxID=29817 RepID=A0AAX6E8S5_IRIPA|nr:hypothetical protein M6B38_109700 [Iris pallida]
MIQATRSLIETTNKLIILLLANGVAASLIGYALHSVASDTKEAILADKLHNLLMLFRERSLSSRKVEMPTSHKGRRSRIRGLRSCPYVPKTSPI